MSGATGREAFESPARLPGKGLRLPALLAVLTLACAPAFAQSPCDGKIQDWLDHPKGANGQVIEPVAGASYVDPVFGTKITRISAPSPTEGTSAVIETLYNGLRGWNADSSQIIAWHRAGARTYEFYQGDAPYAHIGQIVFGATSTLNTSPADIEHIVWDSDDPNVLYYPAYDSQSNRQHPMLMKVTLHPSFDAGGKVIGWASAPTVTIQRDFLAECSAHGVQTLNVISIGHSFDMSYDGDRKLGLRCGVSGGTMWNFLYSIARDVILNPNYVSALAHGYTTYDYPPWASPSGNYSYRQGFGQLYDASGASLGLLTMANSLEHMTVGYTLGDATHPAFDYVAQSAFDELPNSGNLLIWKLSDPFPIKPHVIIGQGVGGLPYPSASVGSHPSLSAKNGSGWMAVGNLGPTGSGRDGVLSNEIMLANVNTNQVCRVAHSRSCGGECAGSLWAYWGETHPQISNDGYRVLFNSDWENSNTVSLFVVDLRPFATTILTTSLPNAVKGEPYHFPLTAAGGKPPYIWSKPVGTFPGGMSLNGAAIDGPSTGVETQTFTLRACDSLGVCNDHPYPLTSQERPVITTASPLPDAVVGMPFMLQPLTEQGGVPPIIWSLASGAFCAGVGLNPDGSWKVDPPITLGACTFGVSAMDSHAQPIAGTKTFSQTIVMPVAGGCPCAPTGLKTKIEVIP